MKDSSEKLQQIQSFLVLSDQIGTAGQPTVTQFEDIRAAGFQTVVNLALVDSTDAIPEESAIVSDLGMELCSYSSGLGSPDVGGFKTLL